MRAISRADSRAGRAAARPLRDLLSGGDRRSIARSELARELVLREPRRLAELAQLATSDDPLVVMRSMDLLDKVAHEHPDWVQPYKGLFIGPLAKSARWELRLQIVRTLPLLRWNGRERRRVLAILRENLAHPQKFVRAWALDSLALVAGADGELLAEVDRGLGDFEASGVRSLEARARAIRARLNRARCAQGVRGPTPATQLRRG